MTDARKRTRVEFALSQASLVLLASLYLYFLLRRGARAFVMRLFAGSGAGHQHH